MPHSTTGSPLPRESRVPLGMSRPNAVSQATPCHEMAIGSRQWVQSEANLSLVEIPVWQGICVEYSKFEGQTAKLTQTTLYDSVIFQRNSLKPETANSFNGSANWQCLSGSFT